MKSIKSIMVALTTLIMIFALTVPVMADEITSETVESVTVEYLEDGSYYETVITVKMVIQVSCRQRKQEPDKKKHHIKTSPEMCCGT